MVGSIDGSLKHYLAEVNSKYFSFSPSLSTYLSMASPMDFDLVFLSVEVMDFELVFSMDVEMELC